MENRIAELKHHLAADDFCLREFCATEAAFRSILLLFNQLGEFQRAAGLATYRQPAIGDFEHYPTIDLYPIHGPKPLWKIVLAL